MTTRTGCGDVERLMLAGEDRELSPEERRLVEGHLHGCGRCRGYAADRAVIRKESAAIPWPALPGEVDRRTRRAVLEAGPAVLRTARARREALWGA